MVRDEAQIQEMGCVFAREVSSGAVFEIAKEVIEITEPIASSSGGIEFQWKNRWFPHKSIQFKLRHYFDSLFHFPNGLGGGCVGLLHPSLVLSLYTIYSLISFIFLFMTMNNTASSSNFCLEFAGWRFINLIYKKKKVAQHEKGFYAKILCLFPHIISLYILYQRINPKGD